MPANLPVSAAPPAVGRLFPGAAEQVREARHFLAGVLDGCPAGVDALLCLSELATNAVLHSRSGRSGGRFAVRAAVRAGQVRVEVEDEGGPWRPGGLQNGQSGRGLAIVAQVASRWGLDDRGDRRVVWFEIDY